MNRTIALGGREFVELSTPTLEGMRFWARCLKKGGLGMISRFPQETDDGFLKRVRARVLESGVGARLMAALLVPEGQPWTDETAGTCAEMIQDTTAELLSIVQDPADAWVVEHLLDRVVRKVATNGANFRIEVLP